MKRIVVFLSVAFLAALFVSEASAHLVTGDRVQVTWGSPQGSTGGGPFKLTTTNRGAGLNETAQSFCIETGEHISINGQYYVNIANEANRGGSAGVTGTDTPALATTMIFRDWLDGNLLTGLDTSQGATSDSVQRAIWFLEGEDATGFADDADAQALVAAYYNDGDSYSGKYSGANVVSVSGVAVAQLWGSYDASTGSFSNYRQDQLVRVPEPAAVAVWSVLGLFGLALIRRRRRKS